MTQNGTIVTSNDPGPDNMTTQLLALLSPAKKQQPTLLTTHNCTQPQFKKEMTELIAALKSMSATKIGELMSISPALSRLNYDRFQAFNPKNFSNKNASTAIATFQGDAYKALDVQSLSVADVDYLQNHLLILSGLYGALRPLDWLQPYRLEMKTALKTEQAANLASFWKTTLTQALNKHIKKTGITHLINCASKEYSNAIDFKALPIPTITCQFKQNKTGTVKMIGIYAKQARGLMVRYMAEKKAHTLKSIKAFNKGGYVFDPVLSTAQNFVFIKKLP